MQTQTSTASSLSRRALPSSLGKKISSESAALRSQEEMQLVTRLLADEPEAWRSFTRNYSSLIFSCIRRVLSRFSRMTDEQDVDEVYARFCFELLAQDKKKLRYFDPEKGNRFSSWIGLLATNATYDYLRRLRRDRVSESVPEMEQFEWSGRSPLEQAMVEQQARIAGLALQELSPRDREFVRLYFAEGCSAEEISERMGIHLKTVYTKKHKITARLERLIQTVQAA